MPKNDLLVGLLMNEGNSELRTKKMPFFVQNFQTNFLIFCFTINVGNSGNIFMFNILYYYYYYFDILKYKNCLRN